MPVKTSASRTVSAPGVKRFVPAKQKQCLMATLIDSLIENGVEDPRFSSEYGYGSNRKVAVSRQKILQKLKAKEKTCTTVEANFH